MKELYVSPVVFNEEPHTYELNGKFLKGVTGILHKTAMFEHMYDTNALTKLNDNKVWKESGYDIMDTIILNKTETENGVPTIEAELKNLEDFFFVCTNEEREELDALLRDAQYEQARIEVNKYNAAVRGTCVHRWCEALDGGTECTDTNYEYAVELAHEYVKMRENLGFSPVCSEYLVSDEDFVASSVDLVLKDKDDNIVLADIKCVSNMDSTYTNYLSWQLSIYKYLFERQNPDVKVNELYGVWLPKIEGGKNPKMFKLEPIPEEQIIALLDCAKRGEKYAPVELFAMPSVVGITLEDYLAAKARIKEDTELVKEFESKILSAFSEHNVKKWDLDGVSFTRVIPSVTQKFDSTSFKKENPDLYAQYCKPSQSKESLRVTIK